MNDFKKDSEYKKLEEEVIKILEQLVKENNGDKKDAKRKNKSQNL